MRRFALRKFLPASTFGRTALVLLAGLVVSNLIGMVFYLNDRSTVIDRARGEAVAERIATIVRTVADAAPEDRAARVEFMRGPGLRARWTAGEPLVREPRTGWRASVLRSAIEEQLGDVTVREIRIGDGAPLIGRFAQSRERRGGHGAGWGRGNGGQPGMMGPGMMGQPAPPRFEPDLIEAAVNVSIQIDDGSWIDFTTFFMPPRPFWSSGQFASIVISTLVVMALALWAVWRATTPLALFTEAAERLGRDVNAPNLDEKGPLEVRRAAQAFNVMQDRVRAFVTDRTQMLAAISHDLRTPITRMKLRAEFIDDEEMQAKTLSDLDEMEAMVAATLAFARDDAAEETRKALDLSALLRQLCAGEAEGGKEVSYDGPPSRMAVLGATGMRRLFANLIDNAVKYGGSAHVALRDQDDGVLVTVEDNGPGIPETELEKVFRPFYRLERSRSRETGGVGLGLSVVRSIARAHGGDVRLVNREGGGLAAEVRLPT